MNDKTPEIICPACGADTLLIRKPKYEGFTRIGEELSCASCRHVFADENEVPFKKKKTISIFSKQDLPSAIKVFEEGENTRLCRYCEHYLVNPFTQRCALSKREVEATDTCDRFKSKPSDKAVKAE